MTDFNGRPPLHATKYDGRPMVPYSAFGESGHHNGIMMTEGLAKTYRATNAGDSEQGRGGVLEDITPSKEIFYGATTISDKRDQRTTSID